MSVPPLRKLRSSQREQRGDRLDAELATGIVRGTRHHFCPLKPVILAEPAGEIPVVRSKGFAHCPELPSAREVEGILNLFVMVRQRDRWETPSDRIAAIIQCTSSPGRNDGVVRHQQWSGSKRQTILATPAAARNHSQCQHKLNSTMPP